MSDHVVPTSRQSLPRSKLPEDVVNIIIEDVPQSSLSACTLVDRTWSAVSSRRLLVHIIVVDPRTTLQTFIQIAMNSERIRSNAKQLTLDGDNGTPLFSILPILPRLTVLQIQNCRTVTPSYDDLRLLPFTRQSVFRLCCIKTNAHVVYWSLLQFDKIEALKVRDILRPINPFLRPPPAPPPPSHHLILDLLSIATFELEMLASIECLLVPNTLKKLYLLGDRATRYYNAAGFEFLDAFLRTVYSSLEHLFCPLPGAETLPCKWFCE